VIHEGQPSAPAAIARLGLGALRLWRSRGSLAG
jgi:hypothetical protein